MEESLKNSARQLKSGNFSSITIVIGNTSCDLDSAVSSLVYSLFLHWQHSCLEGRVCTKPYRQCAESDDIYVPILNVKRRDYELKTEVHFCLSREGLTAENIIFKDDIELELIIKDKDIKVILVDHHVLADEDKYLHEHVREIIDHRPKDVRSWTYREVRATVEQVGSCATLICERIRSNDEKDEFFKRYPSCARLLYETIILDTVNFSKEVKKGTPQDEEQVSYLEGLLAVEDIVGHRAATLSQLVEARRDVSQLTAAQLLRKDTKVLGRVLVPSFPILVSEVLARADVAAALQSELAGGGCALAVLLGMRLAGGGVERELAVCGRGPGEADALAAMLEQSTDPLLRLVALPTSLQHCRLYRQENLAASRKQVMPIVNRYLSAAPSVGE